MDIIGKLLAFTVIGLLLHIADGYFSHSKNSGYEGRVITISAADIERYKAGFATKIGRPATDGEVQAYIDNRVQDLLLVSEALRLGLHQKDDVIHARVYKNVSFLDLENSNRLNASLKGEMIAKDLVVRRRLLERMKALITADALREELVESQLVDYYKMHSNNYVSKKRFRLKHQFYEKVGSKIAESPIQFFNENAFVTESNLSHLLPEALVAQIGALDRSGTILTFQSPVGEHYVEVLEVATSKVAAYKSVRQVVKQDYLKSKQDTAVAEYVLAIKPFYKVVTDG